MTVGISLSAVTTISRGFRARAEERATLELGPRSEQEIRSALEKEVEAERWTNLDRALRNATDDGAGIANLRPHTSENDPELRRLMVGRAAKLERLGLAEQIEPGCWTLKPGLEDTLRDLSIPGRHHQDDASGDGRQSTASRMSQALPCTATNRWMRSSAASSSAGYMTN